MFNQRQAINKLPNTILNFIPTLIGVIVTYQIFNTAYFDEVLRNLFSWKIGLIKFKVGKGYLYETVVEKPQWRLMDLTTMLCTT